MLNEKFLNVIQKEGVVTIVSWTDGEPHVVNTWNSYLVITEDERILIPAYAMRKTEKNVIINPDIKIALGSKEIPGFKDYPGTGFIINGKARFINSGKEFDMMKEKFSFLTRVLEVSVLSAKQML